MTKTFKRSSFIHKVSLETIPENCCLKLHSFDSFSPRKNELKILFRAVSSGDAIKISNYLKSNGDPNIRNSSDQTLMHVAAFRGQLKIVVELMAYSANTLGIDSYNRTPLHYACLGGQWEIVSLLSKTNSDEACGKDIYGCSPSHLAVVSGCLRTVKLSCRSKNQINAVDQKGRTCLFMAVQANFVDIASYLVSVGARRDIGDNTGWRPIHEACSKGYMKLVQLLCTNKKDSSFADQHSRMPLHVACEKGQLKVVKYLCKIGAPEHARVEYGGTILHIACWQGSRDIVEFIHKNTDLDLNVQDIDDETPLHWAAYKGHPEIVEYLVKNGADKTIKSNDGITPGQWQDNTVNEEKKRRVRQHLSI